MFITDWGNTIIHIVVGWGNAIFWFWWRLMEPKNNLSPVQKKMGKYTVYPLNPQH